MADLSQLERALLAADAAAQKGNQQAAEDAKLLAQEIQRLRGAAALEGRSSPDPTEANRQAMEGMKDAQAEAFVQENPIGSRVAAFNAGLPFVGEWVDEAQEAVLGPQAAAYTRQATESMERARPGQSAALRVAGGVTGSLPALAAAPLTAAAPASLWGQATLGGLLGMLGGRVEGKISGMGRGEPGSRVESGNEGGITGAAIGAVTGTAAPMVAEGLKQLVLRLRGLDVKAIASELGIGDDAAKAIKLALDGEDMGQAAANLTRGGDDAMLAEASQGTRALADTAGQQGGRAATIMRDATTQRSAAAAGKVTDALDDSFRVPPGTDVVPFGTTPKQMDQLKRAGIGRSYQEAYSTPIDYSQGPGRNIEALMKRVPKGAWAKARQLIEMDPNIPDEIRTQFLASIGEDGTVTMSKLPSVLELDYVTRALNDVAKAGDGKGALGGATNEGRIFGNLAKAIRKNVRDAVPAYGKALDAAGTEIGIKEAAEFGATMFRPSTSRQMVREALAGAPKAEREAMKTAARQAIDDSIANVRRLQSKPGTEVGEAIKAVKDLSSRAAQDKLAMLLGKDEAARLVGRLDEASTAFEIQAAMAQNSKTAVRQAVGKQVEEATAPNVAQRILAGEPIQAAKRLAQIATGNTPEAQAAKAAGIWEEIASALTQKKGATARAALDRVQKAMSGQPMKEDEARVLARLVTTALGSAAYQTGTRALEAR